MTRRQAATLALLAPLSTLGGCEWLRNMTQPDKKLTKADGPVEPKTREELVNYLNRESEKLTSVSCSRVMIDVTGANTASLNDSSLICRKPKDFSLVGGKKLLGDIVKVGSNSDEFWVYSKYPDPKYIYCSHADFQRGAAQLPFPFDTEWALQALGMSFYDPNLPYRVEADPVKQEHRLSYESTTPQGATVRNVVVFAAHAIADNEPRVRQHLITDAGGKTVATASIKSVTTLNTGRPKTGEKEAFVQVPTEVVLEWPQQQLRMRLKLHSPKINEPISAADARELFTRPAISGVTPVNLTSLQSTPNYRGATPGELPSRKRRGQ